MPTSDNPVSHKVIKMLAWLKTLDRTKHILAISINGEFFNIHADNWNELNQLSQNIGTVDTGVLIIRRIEAGPTLRNGSPYNTLAVALYTHGYWIGLEDEAAKIVHASCIKSREVNDVEEGILFGTFNDEYPSSPIDRIIYRL